MEQVDERHGLRKSAIGGIGIMWGLFYFICWMTVFPDWTHSSWQLEENLMGRMKRFNGLFLRCVSPKDGGFKCDNYGKPTMSQSAELQAQRALMLISILSSLMGLVMGMVSLRCTTMMDNGSKVKSIIGMASGACFLLAGSCVMVATIWFGVQVQNAFYNPKNKNNSFKYEFGSCLYVGWITGALTLIAGLILTVGSCKNMRKGKEASYSTYSYKPQVQASKSGGDKTEYV